MKKNKFDCHTHSNFSCDSHIKSIEDACKQAIYKNLNGIAFTDHLDLDFPDPKYNFIFDFAKRSELLDELKEKYKNKIKILKGLEAGMQPHLIKDHCKIIQEHDFDFVICSVHAIDNLDPFHEKYFQNKTQHQAYHRYLEEILFSVNNFKNYDVIGHIGFIARCCNFENEALTGFKAGVSREIRRSISAKTDRKLCYQDHQDILDTIFKKIISDQKGIEVNTSGYRHGLESPMPNFDIIKRYHELGGEIITIGSDAHQIQDIGYDFDANIQKLKEIGFKYLTYFENRKPVFVKI